MKNADKVLIECTPGACLFTIVDEDGIPVFAEKYLPNERGDLKRHREFSPHGALAASQANALRRCIEVAAPGLFALAEVLNEIEDKSFGGGFVELS